MTTKKKLILSNFQSPGDIVMLTAAVRDLHLCYPNQFLTDVRTSCPELWLNNPYLTPLNENEDDVLKIDCHYPLINDSNTLPYHFIHGFIFYLNELLGLNIKPTAFKGDIHLTTVEKNVPSQVQLLIGDNRPFWIINAGGKYDFTAKWWDTQRYQEVVHYFKDKIQFVQIGSTEHHHPPLEGVIDLRGKTNLRELILLTYHTEGILTPISLPMHLAAAVPTKVGQAKNRACVVIAGGREPMQWEAYPHHQFIHTNGALLCCDNGGCWKSRVKPLGDGTEHDHPNRLCVNVVGELPKCMDMISTQDVVRRIEIYTEKAKINGRNYLAPAQLNGHPTRKLKVGVVIGHYNNIMALQLNIRTIRDNCGDIPILVCDDCSDGYAPTPDRESIFGQLWDIAYQEPNVFLWPNPSRIGHSGGDCSAVWKGIIWAKNLQLDCFAKLSQRFIITLPNWLEDAAKKLMASDCTIMGKTCKVYNFPLRTEAIILKTKAWYRSDILGHLTPRKLGHAFEFVLWDDVRDRLNNKLLTWDILADARPWKAADVLFREANSEEEYRRLADHYGVPWDNSFVCVDSNQMANYVLG